MLKSRYSVMKQQQPRSHHPQDHLEPRLARCMVVYVSSCAWVQLNMALSFEGPLHYRCPVLLRVWVEDAWSCEPSDM